MGSACTLFPLAPPHPLPPPPLFALLASRQLRYSSPTGEGARPLVVRPPPVGAGCGVFSLPWDLSGGCRSRKLVGEWANHSSREPRACHQLYERAAESRWATAVLKLTATRAVAPS